MSQEPEKKTEEGKSEDQVQQINGLLSEFEAAPGSPGGGDGMPAGADATESLQALLIVTFDLVALRRGEHWKLQADESRLLGSALNDVMQKYVPATGIGPEAALVITGGMIFLPRLAVDAANAPPEKQEKPEKGKDRSGDKPKSQPSQ